MVHITINTANLVQGPAYLYWAPFGTAEPTDASVTPQGYLTIPAAPWTDVGGTTGGVTLDIEDTITAQNIDQIAMDVGGRLTKRVIQVTTTMEEATLQNLNLAMNQNLIIGEGTGFQTADLVTTTSATQPSYVSLLIYGWGPLTSLGTPTLRRVCVRKCLSQVKATMTYELANTVKYAVTFMGYFINQNISPVHISEETA